MTIVSTWHVAVVVPAHDEADTLDDCLAAVVRAAVRVRPAVVHVVVVADRCTDGTEAVAVRALSGVDGSVLTIDAGNVGVARGVGVEVALCALPPAGAQRVWVAMTDADSRVPEDWLQRQLAAAAEGWRAVVGGIIVDDWAVRDHRLEATLARYRDLQEAAGIRPVHGANLGVAAAALQTVGGVPDQALSEDAALVRVLETADIPVLWDRHPMVRTSARRSSRAPGGFSTLLDQLEGHS
jgi:glycosyltransferase involved in cell wall biosynthesis